MNEINRSRTPARCRCALALSASSILIASGCAKSPFATYEDDLGPLAEEPAQEADEIGLGLDGDDTCAQPCPAQGSVADVSAEIEAQAA